MRSILNFRGEQLAENLDDLVRQPAVRDNDAVMRRTVKANIVEADGDQIIERRRAALMPGLADHFLPLIDRQNADTGFECPGLTSLRHAQRGEANS